MVNCHFQWTTFPWLVNRNVRQRTCQSAKKLPTQISSPHLTSQSKSVITKYLLVWTKTNAQDRATPGHPISAVATWVPSAQGQIFSSFKDNSANAPETAERRHRDLLMTAPVSVRCPTHTVSPNPQSKVSQRETCPRQKTENNHIFWRYVQLSFLKEMKII